MKPKHTLTPDVKTEEKPWIDPDTILLIESTISITFEAFKVTVACLLFLFVPQKCGDHECEIQEQIDNLDGSNLAMFICNWITLGVFIVHYVLVYLRESWMVEYLDEDDEFGDNNLVMNDHEVLKPYPGIMADLQKINYRVLISSIVGALVMAINCILTGLALFTGDRASGFRTFTTYVTNVLLIITILKTTLSNAYAGIQHHLALSCIHFEPVSYNVIDKDHLVCCRHTSHQSAMRDCEKRKPGYQPAPDTPAPSSPGARTSAASDLNRANSHPSSGAPKSATDSAGAAATDMKLDGGQKVGVELQAVNVVVPAGTH